MQSRIVNRILGTNSFNYMGWKIIACAFCKEEEKKLTICSGIAKWLSPLETSWKRCFLRDVRWMQFSNE